MYRMLLVILFACSALNSHSQSSIYDFKVKDISGGNIDLSTLRGKKILIINVASASSRSSQFEELKYLYDQYKDRGMVILCLPTNDFNHEPRNDQEIKNFFKGPKDNFILCKKLSVKGNNISPLYEWLTQKSKNGVANLEVKGDYQKFYINAEGKLAAFFSGRVSPLALEKAGVFKQNYKSFK